MSASRWAQDRTFQFVELIGTRNTPGEKSHALWCVLRHVLVELGHAMLSVEVEA
jgi:hypothetical protein